jgi:hypothetical protein
VSSRVETSFDRNADQTIDQEHTYCANGFSAGDSERDATPYHQAGRDEEADPGQKVGGDAVGV